MASQQRGRSPSGGPRGQVMGAAASAYPFQGPAAGPGLARHSSGPIPYAISTTLTSLSASMQQQYMQAANATQHPGFREQQMSPSSPHGHISPTHGSISPGTRNPLEMSFPVNEVDQRGAFQSAPSDYNFPPAASGLPDVSQQQHALNSFLVESALQADGQVTAQSVNPTDLLGQAASPFQAAVASSKAPEMERDTSSHSYTNASLEQYGYPSAQQSPGDSLAPASAAFPQGQPLQDWTAMLRSASHQGTAFQGHRRTPSEHSDVSSAPSPFLANTDSFDPADQQRSPLLQSQPDATYQDALGIEQFTISEDVHNHGLSPGPSPGVSPRLNPHVDLNLGQDAAFVLPPSVAHNQFQALGPPEVYPAIKSERVPSLQLNNGSGELGSNGAMAPPEINIEYAAPSKQPTLEPPQTAGDGNALSLPERGGRKGRIRAVSDPYVGGSPLPRSPSAHSSSAFHPRRSLSPHSSVASGSPSSSTKSSRRSSTSSIPNRDYMLGLADPGRSGPGATDSKRVQKHPATFECSRCPKRFTRAYNLRSHLRTHTDERPFVCTVCGKAFARQHDRKRHEGLHSGEKKFVCRGELKSGKPWGCGRRFARADALGRHFRSEAGRACIKPLLDEEATQRQRKQQQQQRQQQRRQEQQQQQQQEQHPPHGHVNEQSHLLSQSDPSGLSLHHQATADLLRSSSSGSNSMTGLADLNGGSSGASGSLAFTLPQALLAQYPVLATLQWDQLGPAGADEADVSGRSSFDASSGGEYYDDDPDASGYVSGPGADFGSVPSGPHEPWPNDGYLSDFGGAGR